MPSLGFLKKKKTKDSSSSDQNTSTTPTSPTLIKDSNLLPSIATSPTQASFPATAAPSSQPQQAHPAAASNSPQQPVNVQSVSTDPSSPSQPASAVSPMTNAQIPAQNNQNVPSISSMLNSNTPAGNAAAQQPQDASRDTKGKYTLTDFTIQRTLGTGSFGRVHLVQSKHNQRFYAIKVLKKAQVVKMKQIEHTNDERKMLQRVKHPFLITLWGTFQDAKNLYMVMDFIEGGELFSLLRKSQVC
jgi:protein kinase A